MMHGDDNYPRVADYFVVAGLTDASKQLDEELAFPDLNHKLNSQPKDPITDICVIDRTLEEKCPQGFTCIENTTSGFLADLNHGSFTAHSVFLCYRRGKDRPPLVDLGVYYEGLENVKSGISIVETTPTGKSANINNKSGMGSFPIYLTYRRAEESAPQSTLVVTDVCIILTNKNEHPPYAYCLVDKNLNKGMIGSSVFLCYKKSMRQVNSVAFRAGLIARYPSTDIGSFSLPETVPLFCLPMGATIECWSKKTKHPLPCFSSFVLTTEKSEKVYGAVVSFYENYPEDRMLEEHKFQLGLLRGDGHKSQGGKTVHTNKAICMLSRWPLFDAFRDFLIYLYRLTVSPIAHAIPIERHIAHFMQNVPFPSVQRPRVQYQMSPMHATILMRPQMTPIPLSGASFLALVDDLGSENVLTLLTLALTEHKIVIHSLRRAEITRVAEALITLLFPFKWQCTYVPLCPLEMAYVLEAPCPFIIGVDSRYFDLYEPPGDVACVNLDTNNITLLGDKTSWKVLPKKSAKQTRNVLENLFVEIKNSCPRSKDEEGEYGSTMFDPDLTRMTRHLQIELQVQETVLKLMATLMGGYRDYLLPITEAPSTGTTDPSSLFNIQGFVRSRERSSQRFFSSLTGTQLFAAFIEERSFASLGKLGNDEAGKAASLVFFDECIERLGNEHSEHVRLIEADDTLKSEHTVFVMPPDEKEFPTDVGYQYNTFPVLQEELFGPPNSHDLSTGEKDPSAHEKQRRKSGSFVIGRRTKQETRFTQKQAKLHSSDGQMWARTLLANAYSIWFGCLSEIARQYKSKAAILRAGHDALYVLQERGCMPLPDETCYRVLMHLCYTYNKPVLAVRVFHFVRNSGTQLSAITYGLYNKAVLESTWPSSNRDGYMLWRKLHNVLQAIIRLRQNVRQFNNNSAVTLAEANSDWSNSRSSLNEAIRSDTEAFLKSGNQIEQQESSFLVAEDSISTGGQSDPGYNSMPKNLVQRGFQEGANSKESRFEQDDSTETKSTETTDSLIGSISEESPECQHEAPIQVHEKLLSGRVISPPRTLLLSAVHSVDEGFLISNGKDTASEPVNQGMQSDDTITSGDNGTYLDGTVSGAPIPHRNGSIVRTPVSPTTSPPISPILDGLEDTQDKVSCEVSTNGKDCDLVQSGSVYSAQESLFGGDSKFLSGLSESDKQMHLQLCGKKTPTTQSHKLPLALPQRGEGESVISPLLGQKAFLGVEHQKAGEKAVNSVEYCRSIRKNFDNLTAEDIATSPPKSRSIFGSVNRSSTKTKIAAHTALAPKSPTIIVSDGIGSAAISADSNAVPKEKEELPEELSPDQKPHIQRHDITDLALDPLSLSFAEPNIQSPGDDGNTHDGQVASGQHLVEEIHKYLNKESSLWNEAEQGQGLPVQEEKAASHSKLKRQSSAPSDSPETPKKHPPPGLLSRSLTFAHGSTLSNSLMSSGSKLNSLLKATTIGMATKAKKLASNLAKDLNETVQTNLAYYTPEKFKGSLPELSEGFASPTAASPNSQKRLFGGGSQSSLYSSESILSSSDFIGTSDIRYRGGVEKNKQSKSRPLSVPSFGNSHDPGNSLSSVPGHGKSSSDLHLASSLNSLHVKEGCDVEVTISSCSRCSQCSCLVYDEEIMAGWLADESNLNTHCPFCNTLFVPFLDIEVKNHRQKIDQLSKVMTAPDTDPATQPLISTESKFCGSPATQNGTETILPDVSSASNNGSLVHESATDSTFLKYLPEDAPCLDQNQETSRIQESAVSHQTTTKATKAPSIESLTVPYLSPLVLRKELESLLENEGTRVLGEGEFVDQHPIIYWNLVWYFRRLNLHSNLYDLVLMSKAMGGIYDGAANVKGNVMVYVMWDNLKLHDSMAKPALYLAYHQLSSQSQPDQQRPYTESFLENIKKSIIADDVKGPLVALLNEFIAESHGRNDHCRRSVYREVLFLVIIALGKECIDVDAFDSAYREAYDSLTVQELDMVKRCDKPPNIHARECRNIFGQLDLY